MLESLPLDHPQDHDIRYWRQMFVTARAKLAQASDQMLPEVMALDAAGAPYAEISRETGLSISTVRNLILREKAKQEASAPKAA